MLKVLLVLFLQAPTDLDGALDALAAVKPGDGAAYVAARDRVLAFGKDAVPALASRGAADRWTEEGWVRAAVAEACRLRLAEPELAATVDALDGIVPAKYRLFRTGKPMLLRGFVRLGPAAVPLLIERWRWTFDLHTFSAGDAGELERATLRNTILSLPGEVSDPRARHFLADVLATPANRDAWKADAAVSLGTVAGTAALPRLIGSLDAPGSSTAIREACARALGRVPDPAALEAIRARLAQEKDDLVRRSFLVGLGILGSSWGWEARGKESVSIANVVRAGCAEALVEALRRHPAEAETIGSGLSMTAWAPSQKALEGLAADASASAEAREAATQILPRLRESLARKGVK
jgi:hypothetical protein